MQTKLFFFICTFLLNCCPLLSQQFCAGANITDALGNENPVINCSYPLNGKCLQLKTEIPVFNKTDSYTVSSETFTPYGDFNAGTSLHAEGDDLFFSKIEIPFNFCFFGNNYNSVIIGTNGVISFDVSQLGNINYPNVQDSNPNTSLHKSSIFGAFSDLVFSPNDDSEIYYSITGMAPCRKLIINFYKGRIVGCNETSTSQIVLSEGSNSIEVFVKSKPLPCPSAKFKNSLLGIISEDRTVGYSPAGRNTGIWKAENEAWKFTPSGSAITPQILWFNSKNESIGAGNMVNVCPEKNEVYTVKVKYPMCGDFDYTLEASTNVTFAPDYPLTKDFTAVLCGTNSLNINLEEYKSDLTPQNANNFIFTYHNSLGEAQNGDNPQPTTFVLSGNKTFFVRVQNLSDPSCFRIAVLNLKLLSNSLLTNTLAICDINNDGVENSYQLSSLNSKLFSAPITGTIHYFLSAQDAANNVDEVTTANIVNDIELYVKYETATCSQVFGPVKITFIASPVVNTPITFTYTTCDFKYDSVELFDYLDIIGPLVTSEQNVILSFYRSYQEAYSGTGSSIKDIIKGKYSVFVRVQFTGGCFSIATVNMDVTFTYVEAKDDSVYRCFDGTQDITVDLKDYSPEMLLQSPVGISVSYFKTSLDAENDQNPISNLQTITTDGSLVRTSFYVRFEDSTGCYAVKEIEINLVHVIIHQTQFEICDFENDGQENTRLSSFNKMIVGSQNATVSYFISQTDADNNNNPLTTYNIQNGTKLFVKIVSYVCSNVFEINLMLVPTPTVKTVVEVVKNSVCDNNNDGQEPFDLTGLQSEIYADTAPVSFQYYQTYDAASNSLSGLIANPTTFSSQHKSTVYAKVSNGNGGCYSVSTINITLNFLPVIVIKPAVLQKCDFDFNLNESFTLSDAIPDLFSQAQNSILLGNINITYYKTELEANNGIPSTQITSPVITAHSRFKVWVRFTSKTTFCFSVTSIELQTYIPPKALNSKISGICDDNLDGLYDVDLTKFTSGMIYTQSADNHFTFFYTKAEADQNVNPILNPDKFTFNASVTRIWVRVQNIPGCFDTASVDLNLGQKVKLINNGPFTITNTCDVGNDGTENIDLTQFESSLYSPATFEYYPSLLDLNNNTHIINSPKAFLYNENSGTQKVFVKIKSPGFCPEKAEINLSLKKTPMFTLPDYNYCPESFVDIKPDFSNLNIVTFEWLDPTGKVISKTKELLGVKTAGLYKINVTAANGCTFSTTFNVKVFEIPVITDLIANGNTITVIATGSRKILYSKDGINFVENNVFTNLPFGITTFYVKFEGSDCLPNSKEGVILNIRNAFTPNADGYNDTWIIDDLNVFNGKSANLKVFNRFLVKVFEQDSSSRFVWNGTFNSRLVNTGSYWYQITLPDGRTYTGWVLVKNRN
ncbi:hypothetical protein OA86_08405 [Kaistella jeonii]|uniref:Gliding motility-associated C-terminal domain-containing protein n=1 Tax=Kaistella jeonii TaxID=266749 RepID=A0A0C1FMB8_9FLAO|nr:hypothetical protein OA86_08405 [Kaistella jeonii]